MIVTDSKFLIEYLKKEFNVDTNKIKHLYNFIEPPPIYSNSELIEIKKKNDINANKKIILYIGRITKQKGCINLLKAFQILSNKIENTILLFVGELDKKIGIVKNLKSEKIVWIPPVENVYDFYAISDVVVLPSLIDAVPYIVFEAGISKKPFAGSRIEGISEIIKDKYNGMLFDPASISQIADSLELLLTDKLLSAKCAENLYESVKSFSANNYFEKFDTWYKNLCSL
jgi:glycosyltransferase involved in cell wall biosynthesis